jgi:hypothetical protein
MSCRLVDPDRWLRLKTAGEVTENSPHRERSRCHGVKI